MKSISFFGLAHSIQRKKIQEACRQEYPQIVDQIHSDYGFLGISLLTSSFLEMLLTRTNDLVRTIKVPARCNRTLDTRIT